VVYPRNVHALCICAVNIVLSAVTAHPRWNCPGYHDLHVYPGSDSGRKEDSRLSILQFAYHSMHHVTHRISAFVRDVPFNPSSEHPQPLELSHDSTCQVFGEGIGHLELLKEMNLYLGLTPAPRTC
jgi:hypothetical protein